jgi:hypothetical protein
MKVGSVGACRQLAAAASSFALAVALVQTAGPVSAAPQRGSNKLPNQPVGNPKGSNPYSAAYGQGRYTPYPVRDPTAAERAEVARRVYRTTLGAWVQRAAAPRGPGGPSPDQDLIVGAEFAERLGRWSLRLQEAEDNAAKSLAGRYQALTNHLARMSSLEDGRFLRPAAKPGGLPKGRPVNSKSSVVFAEIARFFRPVDERGIDRVVPEIIEYERPLNPVGVAVTATDRVEIAGRVYRSILDAAVDQFLSQPGAGEIHGDLAAIFDAPLAERLANWSDLWRQAQDDAATDESARLAVARNGPTRLALAGTRLTGPDVLPATLKAHVERMRELETGRFVGDAVKQTGRPAARPLDMTRLGEFVAVAKYFRIEAESQLPESSRPKGAGVTASSRAAAAGQIYSTILDGAARRHLAIARAGDAPALDGSVFDSRLAERLGAWSIRWGRAQARAGEGAGSQFTAVRSHFERMAALEDGRALYDSVARDGPPGGQPNVLPPPGEFAEIARFFRLEARWELELIKSR